MAKRILALMLSVVMLFSITVSAYADDPYANRSDTTYSTSGDTAYDVPEDVTTFLPQTPMLVESEPVTASVYTLDDDTKTYSWVEEHDETHPLDVEDYSTIYVLQSNAAQKIYFERIYKGTLGEYGAFYSISDSKYAELDKSNQAALGTYKNATVTLAAGTPAGTEITLTAEHTIWGRDVVKIVVLDELPDEILDDIVMVDYPVNDTENGVGVALSAAEDTFPAGTSATVTDDATVTGDDVSGVLDSDAEIKGIVAVDITFTCGGKEVQPNGNVIVSLNIPDDQVPEDANMYYVVHLGENGPELITSQYLNTTGAGQSITFGANSFSSYAAVFVNGKYQSKKMSEELKDNPQYSIHTFDVNLFDYDPEKMNTALRGIGGGQPFLFRGFSSVAQDTGTDGVNNSTAEFAKQGIVQSTLVNGLPVFNYIGGTDGGTQTGQYLFGTYAVDGKKQYQNTKFQFIYDETTGYYQYKSAANHAQYNDKIKTIELYADTLSTKNQNVATLDLTSHIGQHGLKEEDDTDGVYKAIAYKGKNDSRLDPYVSFTVPKQTNDKTQLTTAKIDKIYVKAKVDKDVGANTFQLYFKKFGDSSSDSAGGTWDEYKDTMSFKCNYTATGDYIEFVIDTSENKMWKEIGTVTDIRIDLFDSSYSESLQQDKEYQIEIAQISFIQDYDNYVTRGGFYPFSDIEKSYPGNGSQFSESDWKKAMEDNKTVNVLSSRSIFNHDASATELIPNLYFGVVMEFDFYIPVDKKVNGEDLTYYFNGDDDLWVFIDNELALDIGGGHGGITGSINLSTGKSTVESVKQVTDYNTAGKLEKDKETTIPAELTTPGKHTMKIFYMERCGSVSNCFMKFNLPQTPQGDVVVSKNVNTTDGSMIDALNNQEFMFTISAEGNGDNMEPLTMANKEYTLYEKDGTAHQKSTDASGQFKLKNGQYAVFKIAENYNITVTETLVDVVSGYKRTSTTVNGATKETETLLTKKGEQKKFDFVNTYDPQYGALKITKTGISNVDHNDAETQNTLYQIKGTSDSGVTIDMTVTIVGNDFTVVEHLPVGKYTVTEVTDWSWRYNVTGHENKWVLTVTAGETATNGSTADVKNEREEYKWLSGDCYARNWWGTFSSTADSAPTT